MISLLPGSSSSFTSLSSSNNANNALFKRRQQQQQQQQQQRNGRMIKAVSFLRSHYFFTTNTNENASNNNNNNNNNNDNNNNRRRKKRRDALLKVVRATKEDKKSSTAKEVDEITKKWGLEAGLWKIFKSSEKNNSSTNNNKTGGEGAQQLSGSRMNMAKQLLKTYGSAYLITSISLSLVSFGVFYVLVSSGVDVAALLSVIGITATQNSEKVGTVAIAYAAHKAASPIRFPPTVALTPIVAGWMGKTGNKGEEEEEVGEGGEEK